MGRNSSGGRRVLPRTAHTTAAAAGGSSIPDDAAEAAIKKPNSPPSSIATATATASVRRSSSPSPSDSSDGSSPSDPSSLTSNQSPRARRKCQGGPRSCPCRGRVPPVLTTAVRGDGHSIASCVTAATNRRRPASASSFSSARNAGAARPPQGPTPRHGGGGGGGSGIHRAAQASEAPRRPFQRAQPPTGRRGGRGTERGKAGGQWLKDRRRTAGPARALTPWRGRHGTQSPRSNTAPAVGEKTGREDAHVAVRQQQ